MASCRTGRLALINDPFWSKDRTSDMNHALRNLYILTGCALWFVYHFNNHPHKYIELKGPKHPGGRVRHRRFPIGGLYYGWGNNGLNRDCNLLEMECWAGYTGKEYTY